MAAERDIDLTKEELVEVARIFRHVMPEARVCVFGSRATGRARRHSDLDLLIVEPPRLVWRQLADLRDAFEASVLPFRVDLVEAGALEGRTGERILAESLSLPHAPIA